MEIKITTFVGNSEKLKELVSDLSKIEDEYSVNFIVDVEIDWVEE